VPVSLDDTDLAILKSLMQDGRKSFRAISREIKVSTPTIKARYERLVNMGLIKSVRPELDVSKIDASRRGDFETEDKNKQQPKLEGLKVKMVCEFCGGPIHGRPKVLKFAGIERFFCCTACRAGYKEKHGGRIQSLIEQHKEQRKQSAGRR
jgi:Lrp/AsnC family leucine-responsive transcriptional regulator